MARPKESLKKWLETDQDLKEKWIKSKYSHFLNHNNPTNTNRLVPTLSAVLSTHETLIIPISEYEKLRQGFRVFKFQQAHNNENKIQLRVSKKTKTELERLRKKLEVGSLSQTVSRITDSFDTNLLKQKEQIEQLKTTVQESTNYIAYLKNKYNSDQNELKKTYETLVDFLLDECVSIISENSSNEAHSTDTSGKLTKDIRKQLNAKLKLKLQEINALKNDSKITQIQNHTTLPLNLVQEPLSENLPKTSSFTRYHMQEQEQEQVAKNESSTQISQRQNPGLPSKLLDATKLLLSHKSSAGKVHPFPHNDEKDDYQ